MGDLPSIRPRSLSPPQAPCQIPPPCRTPSECGERSLGSARLTWGSSVLQRGQVHAQPNRQGNPLPLVPQEWVLCKQGTKRSIIFFKRYLFPRAKQVGLGSHLGFDALQKTPRALPSLKSPHLQDGHRASVHSSGCGLHSIKRSQTEGLQTTVFRGGFLPASPRSCLASPACVPCHKR